MLPAKQHSAGMAGRAGRAGDGAERAGLDARRHACSKGFEIACGRAARASSRSRSSRCARLRASLSRQLTSERTCGFILKTTQAPGGAVLLRRGNAGQRRSERRSERPKAADASIVRTARNRCRVAADQCDLIVHLGKRLVQRLLHPLRVGLRTPKYQWHPSAVVHVRSSAQSEEAGARRTAFIALWLNRNRTERPQTWRGRGSAARPSPGADVGGVSPVPVQPRLCCIERSHRSCLQERDQRLLLAQIAREHRIGCHHAVHRVGFRLQ